MRDPTTKHSRGFGFVTFADPEAVEKVIQFGVHNLDGKKIDPKVAFPKESTPKVRERVRIGDVLKVLLLICESIGCNGIEQKFKKATYIKAYAFLKMISEGKFSFSLLF